MCHTASDTGTAGVGANWHKCGGVDDGEPGVQGTDKEDGRWSGVSGALIVASSEREER